MVPEPPTPTKDTVEVELSLSEEVVVLEDELSLEEEPSSLLLQEMIVKLRNTEKMMSRCFMVYWFVLGGVIVVFV